VWYGFGGHVGAEGSASTYLSWAFERCESTFSLL